MLSRRTSPATRGQHTSRAPTPSQLAKAHPRYPCGSKPTWFSQTSQDSPKHHHGLSATPEAGAAYTDPAGAAAVASTSGHGELDDFCSNRRPVILFDGVCNMCNAGVNFVLDWDKDGVYRMAALQSQAGRRLLQRCGRSPDDISSIVLVEEDRHFIKSEAVLRIAQRLDIPWPLLSGLASPVPLFLRDAVYDTVATNRYAVLGRRNACRVDDGSFSSRFLVE